MGRWGGWRSRPVQVFRPGDPRTLLNAERRARDLDDLSTASQVCDVLVVGGGVTGAGVALDAASRGLSVVLVEKHDLAFGTSRWSSKLVHGGLRYLAHGDLAVAAESARERGLIMERIAPHLTHALATVVPYGDPTLGWPVDARAATLVDVGARAGNLLRAYAGTSTRTLPSPRRAEASEVTRLVPAVRAAGLSGGVLWWDGQLEDDARFVVALARTAAGFGARILTRVSAVKVAGDGAVLRDERTGQEFVVRARSVINATGVWAGDLDESVRLRPSKGVHLVLPASAMGGLAAAVAAPVPGSTSRYVFALPHPDGVVYVGITDDPLDGPVPDVPVADPGDVAFLLDTMSRILERPLSETDVIGTYAGLRPLPDLGGDLDASADISRKHMVARGPDGQVTVTGGKFTTYRQMAEDAVDLVTDRPCRTKDIGLVGAGSAAETDTGRVPTRLVRKYGIEAEAVAALAAPDPVRLSAVTRTRPELGVELAWGAYAEGALTAEDLLDRRTRIGLVDGAAEAARPIAEHLVSGA